MNLLGTNIFINKDKSLTTGAVMGIIMQKYRGIVDGKTLSELVRKYKH